jgi:hypothetical protein
MKLDIEMDRSFFLSLDTDCLSSSTSGLGVLASDFEAPFVSDTLVASDLVQSFDVFSELSLQNVRSHLEVLSLLVVFLSVEEPSGDAVSLWVADDVGDTVALGFSHFAGSEFGVDSEDFADKETESPSDTLDLIEGVGDGSLAVDVGVENTMDMLEGGVGVFNDE